MALDNNTALTFVENDSSGVEPNPAVVSVSKTKISDETDANLVEIRFTFDTDVTQWTVNVMGVDQTTGAIADSGGAVSAGVEITALIDWTELYQEGQNRVNIYGQNINGWTPYDENSETHEIPIFLSPRQIIIVSIQI